MKAKKEDILLENLYMTLNDLDRNELADHLLNTISLAYQRLLDDVEKDKQEEMIEGYFMLITIHLKNVKENLINCCHKAKQ